MDPVWNKTIQLTIFVIIISSNISCSYIIPENPVPDLSSQLLNLTRNISSASTKNENRTTTTPPPSLEYSESDWITPKPNFRTLFFVVPIAFGILLTVLVFFLYIFSERAEITEQYDYEQLIDPVMPGPSTSAYSSSSTHPDSPTHPVVDQILDVPYTNPNQEDSTEDISNQS